MGRHRKEKVQKVEKLLHDEDRQTIRLQIRGVPYELEYGDYMTIKNLNTKTEAPLDTLPYADLVLIADALNSAAREIEAAEEVVDSIAQLYEINDFNKPDYDHKGWNTKKEAKDVDDKVTVQAVNAECTDTD